MATTDQDISVVYSGGSSNFNPNLSLGGDPSNTPIASNILNNLFDDISPDESIDGHEDHRCIYFFNDGDSTIYDVKLWIDEEFGNTPLQLGIKSADEVQRITISNATLTGGSFSMTYDGLTFESAYNSDLAVWSTALQATLRSLQDAEANKPLADVTVTAQTAGSDIVIFDIRFGGQVGKRTHPALVLQANNLLPGTAQIVVTTTQTGGPVNTIAPTIDNEIVPPGGVTFADTSEVSPVLLPKLEPSDGFPLWVKRSVDNDSSSVANDGFRLRFKAQALPEGGS